MDHFQKPLSYHNGVLMKALHTQVVPRYIQYMSAASEVNSILINHVQEKRHSRNELVRVHQTKYKNLRHWHGLLLYYRLYCYSKTFVIGHFEDKSSDGTGHDMCAAFRTYRIQDCLQTPAGRCHRVHLFFLESALFPEVLIYSILQFYKDWDKCQIAGDLPSALFDAL